MEETRKYILRTGFLILHERLEELLCQQSVTHRSIACAVVRRIAEETGVLISPHFVILSLNQRIRVVKKQKIAVEYSVFLARMSSWVLPYHQNPHNDSLMDLFRKTQT